MTGPTITALCHAIARRDVSQGSCSGVTMSAGRARFAGAWKARPMPKTRTSAKIGSALVGFESA